MKQQYIDLAERCEAAEAGSRELDAEIAVAVGWEHRSGQPWSKVLEWEKPAYTTSLDAAMTLGLEDFTPLQLFLLFQEATNRWFASGSIDPFDLPRFISAAICRTMGEG